MEQQELQLNQYLRLFWKGKWIILLTTLLGLGGVLMFERQQPPPVPSFRATATVMVEPVGSPVGGLAGLASLGSGERSINTQIELMVSRNVMERALAKLQPPAPGEEVVYTPFQIEALRSSIKVRPISTTNLLEVRARGTTPETAEQRANALVQAYIDYIKDERVRAIEDSLADLRAQLDTGVEDGDLQSQAAALFPGLGAELADIAQFVERSAQALEQLQVQEPTVVAEPLLSLEASQIEKMAEELASISSDLQTIRERLDGAQAEAEALAESPLSLEASRLESTVEELSSIHQDIRDLQNEMRRTDPLSIFRTLATRSENIEEILNLVPSELQSISGGTVESSRQLLAIREYVDAVANDMGDIASDLRSVSDRRVTMSESKRILLEGDILSFTLGLQSAADDLDDFRNLDSIDVRDYGRILNAKGRLETSITQLNLLKQDLEGTAGSDSLDDALTDVMDWVQEGKESIEALAINFRDLEALPDASPDPELVLRASKGIDGAVIILETASGRLLSLRTGATDPLIQARLGAVASRLASAQLGVADSAARLTAVSIGETVTLADRMGVVQGRIEEGSEGLLTILDNLQVVNHLPSTVLETDVANQAYIDIIVINRSLDIASRQLRGLLGGGVDPILEGELSFLTERMSTSQGNVAGISQRLLAIATEDIAVEEPPQEIPAVKNSLEAAAATFSAAAVKQQEMVRSLTGPDQEMLTYTKEQTDTGVAILTRVQGDLSRLQAQESDPLRYGQLVVLGERIITAQIRATETSSQIQQLQGGPGPEYLEMRKLEQQLELSLLQPQDTGITLVDSAVTPQATSASTIFDGLRIPMGAVAGLFLGGLTVFVRSQLDQTVRSQARIRDQIGLATLGVVPKGKAPDRLHPPMVGNQRSPAFAEALQMIGTRLSGPLNNGVRSFLITSGSAKEGKTMLVANLAQLFAQYGKKVLVIDGNLRKPELARALNLPDEDGLATALAQHRNPTDFVIRTESFAVLPAGKALANPAELLTSPAMAAFLQQAQRDFDVVLIDSPPAIGFAETKALAKEVGGIVLVVRSGESTVDRVKQSQEELRIADVPLVGAVLNFANSEECRHLRHEKYGATRAARRWGRSRAGSAPKAAKA
ncbi:MAG: polysaccharide biosynthesis tyrosine autokinase [Dehalococcoidia bacterium]